ncbi:MAG: glycosyltransferase [Prevotella sp.]|nr:glycosyltransferase [Prevotella sp.]
MTKFTVITITYNAAAVLQRTLDSVLHQTYEDVEHLIIDGASTDGTLQMANDYKVLNDKTPSNFPCLGGEPVGSPKQGRVEGPPHKVIIHSSPDEGIYYAMNKGLTQASGDYVVFMNAGDFFPSPDTLEQIAHRCHLNELPSAELPAVVYGNTDIVDAEGHYLHPRRLQPPEQLTWRSFRHGMLVCHQAFYVRTDLAKNTQYDTRYRYSADVDWCIRVMREADRMGLPLANAHLTVACYTEEGTTTRHHRDSLLERYHVMAHHYGHLSTFFMHCWFALRSVLRK